MQLSIVYAYTYHTRPKHIPGMGPFNNYVTLKTALFNPHPYVTLRNDKSIMPTPSPLRYLKISVRIHKILKFRLNRKVVSMTFNSNQT